MNTFFVKIGDTEYEVRLGETEPSHRMEAWVSEICRYIGANGEDNGFSYRAVEGNDDFTDNFTENVVLCSFYLTWRGCWDWRLYPKGEEFYPEQLEDIVEVAKQSLPIMKQAISKAMVENGEYDPIEFDCKHNKNSS